MEYKRDQHSWPLYTSYFSKSDLATHGRQQNTTQHNTTQQKVVEAKVSV